MKKFRSIRAREEITAILYLLPAILLILGLIGYPFIYSFYLSLTSTTIGRPGDFVGLSNYTTLARNPLFLQVLKNSIIYTVIAVIIKLIIGTGVAVLLKDLKGRWAKFVRGTVLLPWVVPSSLSAIAWWWMFNPRFSVFNWIITKIFPFSSGINWLGDSFWAMFAVIMVNIWRGVPFYAISFIAGLVAIDEELYEAAATEGANRFQQFFYISLPLLKPILAVVTLFSVLMTISEFNTIYVITKGGPAYATHLLSTFAFEAGIAQAGLSRGAAISLFLFPILLISSYFQIRVVRRGVRK